jgi:integrase/recombinase XerD
MTELEYVIAHSPRLRPRTKTIYAKAVQSFLAYAGDHPSTWTGIAVESWRDSLAASGLKPQTVNLYLTGLKYSSKRLAARHHNPVLDFAGYAEQLKAEPPKERRALSFEEGRALIDACRGPRPIDLRDLAITVLGLRTGMRRAGLCGIRFEDFADTRLTITLKGGKQHVLAIDDEVLVALTPWTDWLEQQGVSDGYVFRSLSRPRLDGSVLVGGPLRPDGLYKALRKRAKDADLSKFHPHIFRHTFVTWMRFQGVPDWKIAQVTGHKMPGSESRMIDHYTSGGPLASAAVLPSLL